MDIAALSTQLSQMDLHSEISTALMKKAMDNATSEVTDVSDLLDASAKIIESNINPDHLGKHIDIRI